MLGNTSKRNRNIMRQILPVCISLCICLAINMILLSAIQKEVHRNAQQHADYLVQNIDTQITSIKITASEVLANPQVRQLARATSEDDAAQLWKENISAILSEINSCQKRDKFIEDVIVYFPNLDHVASCRGWLSTKHYLLLNNLDLSKQPQMYSEAFFATFGPEDRSIFTCYNPSTEQLECYYLRRMPVDSALDACDYTLLIRINPDAVNAMLEELAKTMTIQCIDMSNEQAQSFAHVGKLHDSSQGDPSALGGAWMQQPITVFSHRWQMNITILHEEPESRQLLKILSAIIIVGLLIAVTVGVFLELRNHHRQEKYVQAVMKKLNGTEQDNLDQAVDRYLHDIAQKNLANIQLIDWQRFLVKYAFLQESLKMSQPTQPAVEHLCAIFDISFENTLFSFSFTAPISTQCKRGREDIFAFIRSQASENNYILWTNVDSTEIFFCCFTPTEDEPEPIQAFRTRQTQFFGCPVYGCQSPFLSFSEALHAYHLLRQTQFDPNQQDAPQPHTDTAGPMQPEPAENESRQSQLASSAVQIIDEEYANPQISLGLIAERLGVSQSHLSRIFKQQYDENISHYLNRVRIEHAKVLIRNTDNNLNTIALQVGFLSDMNFIRVFKKMESTTPGTYRKAQTTDAIHQHPRP